MMERRFGWWPTLTALSTLDFSIQPLHEDQSEFEHVRISTRTNDGWFYPPLKTTQSTSGQASNEVLVYAETFSLPPTHRIEITPQSDANLAELSNFLVILLGLLDGLQLQPEGWNHFYRTPIEIGKLVDFISTNKTKERVLTLGYRFWTDHRHSRVSKLMFGALHWHLFGASYQHPFERFAVEYTVLDTIWNIHCELSHVASKNRVHARRPIEICDQYDIAKPSWLSLSSKNQTVLSSLRNDFVHEGLWGGEAIGFAHPPAIQSIHFELFHFNSRILLAMLGERSDYTTSLYNRQQWGLE